MNAVLEVMKEEKDNYFSSSYIKMEKQELPQANWTLSFGLPFIPQVLLNILGTHSLSDTIFALKEIIKGLSVYGKENVLTRPRNSRIITEWEVFNMSILRVPPYPIPQRT